MNRIIEMTVEQIKPEPAEIMQAQGIPANVPVPERVMALYDSAEEIFFDCAKPIGIMADISVEAFKRMYYGKGLNAPDTPLEKIFPLATGLALFASTLGLETSREIESQINNNEMALGYMLDAIASFCTDKASHLAQEIFLNHLTAEGMASQFTKVLLYSPGYCGWHISGQGKLFDYLKPGKIGIHLNESYLMVPLKSISGVLVAGEADIHRFVNNYSFCNQCTTKNCRERMI